MTSIRVWLTRHHPANITCHARGRWLQSETRCLLQTPFGGSSLEDRVSTINQGGLRPTIQGPMVSWSDQWNKKSYVLYGKTHRTIHISKILCAVWLNPLHNPHILNPMWCMVKSTPESYVMYGKTHSTILCVVW